MARRRPPPRPDDAPPRSEEEWEAEFRRMDLITDRFGELLETLHDDPDRHSKIAKEMGWFEDGDAEIVDAGEDDEDDGRIEELDDDDPDDVAADHDIFADEDDDDEVFSDRRDRLAVPAYGAAVDLGQRVMAVVDEYRGLQTEDPADEPTTDGESDGELFGRAFIGVQIAGAKLIGGHAMGYDDEVLCGNIVNCKRGLAAIVDGRGAWQTIGERKLVPAELVADLLAEHDDVIRQIEERIADLRSRVHW